MSRIETRLGDLGIVLPAAMIPPGNFKLVNVHEGLAYIAGHPPIDGSTLLVQGVVGRDLTLEEGYEAARLTALSILASLKEELGELDRVSNGSCGRLRSISPRLPRQRESHQWVQ
jgi:YjgF/chorismate_mutase-like, putative endoribonuclease